MEPAAGFFRRQSGRLVSALTRIFGVHNVALAEDVTQDALCRALSVWRFSGVPDDPAAWLMAVAKNRALDILRHDKTARRFAPELGFLLDSEWTLAPTVIDLFEPRAVTDGELRMMFSCCAGWPWAWISISARRWLPRSARSSIRHAVRRVLAVSIAGVRSVRWMRS